MTVVWVRNEPYYSLETVVATDVVVDLFSEDAVSTVCTDVERIFAYVGYPQQSVLDLALLAVAVYIADKQTLRRSAPDNWRRAFEVHLPVCDVQLWQNGKELVESALGFLTGDLWHLDFRQGENALAHVTPPFNWGPRFDAVSLFSGGLDSFVGAIDLLESGRTPLLIGHWENHQTKHLQSDVFGTLEGQYNHRGSLLSIRVSPRKVTGSQQYPLPNQNTPESTTRSRSLLFLALGLLAANAVDSTLPLYVPENGFISINVPWSANRYGSCTTRSTHPYFLALVKGFLQHLGIQNPIRNPYQYQTKGEMLERCHNQSVLRSGENDTISCSHPTGIRWRGLSSKNCGYCLPCIVRRAAFHRVGRDVFADHYAFDVTQDDSLVLRGYRGGLSRAILHGLHSHRPVLSRLLASGMIPQVDGELRQYLSLYETGVAEIRQFFTEKASSKITNFGGLAS